MLCSAPPQWNWQTSVISTAISWSNNLSCIPKAKWFLLSLSVDTIPCEGSLNLFQVRTWFLISSHRARIWVSPLLISQWKVHYQSVNTGCQPRWFSFHSASYIRKLNTWNLSKSLCILGFKKEETVLDLLFVNVLPIRTQRALLTVTQIMVYMWLSMHRKVPPDQHEEILP